MRITPGDWNANLYAHLSDTFTDEDYGGAGNWVFGSNTPQPWTPVGTEVSNGWLNDSNSIRNVTIDMFGTTLSASGGSKFSWDAKVLVTMPVVVGGVTTQVPAYCPIYAEAYLNAMAGNRDAVGMPSDPVNSATGNLYDHHDDLDSPLFGMGWSRSYNSLDGFTDNFDYSSQPRVLGPKWVTPVDVHLRPLDTTTSGAAAPGQTGGLEYLAADGQRVVIPADHSGSTVVTFTKVPDSLFASVTFANHVFTMTFSSGEVDTFDDLGRLLTRSDGAGQVVTVCRSAAGFPLNLRTGTDCGAASPAGQLSFTDTAPGDGVIDRVTRQDGVFVDYQYLRGRLRSVSYPRGANESGTPLVQGEAGTAAGAGSSGDGGLAVNAQLDAPAGMAYDSVGNLYVADRAKHRVRRIGSDGSITTVAGNGSACTTATATDYPCGDTGQATAAQLNSPEGVAVNASGDLFIADTQDHRIRRVDRDGIITSIAGTGTPCATPTGGCGNDSAAKTAAVNAPTGIAVDKDNNVVVADTGDHMVRKVASADGGVTFGTISKVAGTGAPCTAPAASPACGDNAEAALATVTNPAAVAVASDGSVYVADTDDHRVRRVASGSNPTITTVAGNGSACTTATAALNPCGDNGAASSAQLTNPRGIGFDAAGNLYIADTGDNRIRKVAAGGSPTITTVTGTGTAGFNGDLDDPVTRQVNAPAGLAVEDSGTVHVADTGNHRVRFVAAEAGYRLYSTPDELRGIVAIEHTTRPGRLPLTDIRTTFDTAIPGRVLTQEFPSGDHVSFSYPAMDIPIPATTTTVVTWCSGWNGTVCGTGPTDTTESTTYVHGTDGRLISMKDTTNHETTMSFDRDRPAGATDRAGAQTATEYDAQGRPVAVAEPDPGSGFVPPRSGDACARTAVAGHTYYAFPAPGSGSCAGDGTGSTSKGAFSVTTYTYCTDEAGLFDPRVATVTDPLGEVTRYLYGSTDPGTPCPVAYANQSTPTRVIAPGDHVTDIETVKTGGIDTGLVKRVIDPDLVVTTTEWDVAKRLKLSDAVGPNRTFYGYDAQGRLIVTHTAAGIETWQTYDGAGRPVDRIGPATAGVTTCSQTATTCAFPASVPAGFDGPTTHTEYYPDGSTAAVKQRTSRNVTAGERTTVYDSDYKSGTASCVPPAAGCGLETTVKAPPHAYDPAHPELLAVTVTTTRYNASGAPVTTTTAGEINTAGVVSLVDSATATTNYQTNPAVASTNLGLGRVASTATPTGIVTALGYDGNLDATGNSAAGGNGVVTSTATGANLTTSFYDKRGRVTEVRGPVVVDETSTSAASCVHTTFDAAGRTTKVVKGTAVGALGSGCTTTTLTKSFYDAAGHQTYQVLDVNGGTTTDPTTCGATPVVDPADLVTQTSYTPGGRATDTIVAPVDVTTFNWCTGTGKRTTTNKYDIVTGTTVDAAKTGRLVEVNPPDPATQASMFYVYDADGRVLETNLKTGGVLESSTKSTYDPAGRVLTSSVPSPAETGDTTSVTCYNEFGEKTYQSDPHTGVSLTAPCGTDHLGADKATYKQYQSFAYYDDGSLKTSWSALRGSLGTTNEDLATATNFYDGRGNRTARTTWTCSSPTACDAAHTRDATHWHPVVEKWEYDADNHLTAYVDPIQVTQSTPAKTLYAYYANGEANIAAGQLPGQLKSITQPSGRTQTNKYRADGQVVEQKHTFAGSPDVTLAFAYNAFGQRTRMSDQVGTAAAVPTVFTRDNLGRITAQAQTERNDGAVKTDTWAYDLAGNVRQIGYHDGATFRYDHNPAGQVTAAKGLVAGTGVWATLAQYSYNHLGRALAETTIGGGNGSRTYTYPTNNAALPTGFSEHINDDNPATTGTDNINTATATKYGPDGRRLRDYTSTTIGTANTTTTTNYGYDDAGELCLASTPTTTPVPIGDSCTAPTGTIKNRYSYNTRGMRMTQTQGTTTTNYTYNDNAQMQTATPATGAATTYHWDDDGRRDLVDTGTGATEMKTTTTYDARGMVASIGTQRGTATAHTVTQNYNADGLLARVVDGYAAFDSTWDPTTPIPQVLEARATDSFQIRAVYGRERLAVGGTPGDPSAANYYAYDALGSVMPTSAIAAPSAYDPYGAPTTSTTGSFTYRAEQTLSDLNTTDNKLFYNLIYLRARTYDPVAGVFTTRDPLDGVDGTTDVANPYAYVSNDPLNMVDPRGLRKQDSDRDWKPPPPPVMQPSDCALYRTGKIRDYLHGAEQPPCGFKDAVYTPDVIRGFHGNATVYAGPADKVDACSGKMLTLVSNTITNPFSGTSSEEVERAYKEFDVSCRAHDYAYDLIRFAWNNEDWKSRVNGRSDLVRDREDADGEMREISTGVCNDASWVAWRDVWDKFVCWKLRDLMYNGLRVWTKVEGIPK